MALAGEAFHAEKQRLAYVERLGSGAGEDGAQLVLEIIGPAGIAHMSVADFATWAGWNAGEGKRGPALVKPETLKRLHQAHIKTEIPKPKPGTPKSGSYALGWGLSKFDWTDKPVLTHNGSNSMNLAMILVDVDNDAGIVAVTNFPGDKADAALLATAKELYERYVKSKQATP